MLAISVEQLLQFGRMPSPRTVSGAASEDVVKEDASWADPSLLVGLPMAVRAALMLNVPKIIDSAHPKLSLSAEEICKHVSTTREHTPKSENLEKILDWLCCNGIFSLIIEEGDDGSKVKRYAHSPKSRCLSRDQTADMLLLYTCPELTRVWPHAHEIVLSPDVSPFELVTGKNIYTYLAVDAPHVQELFVRGLNRTAGPALGLLEKYDETFKALKGRVVDVGGQEGTMCAGLVAKYPHLQFVNFDLPEVVKGAPQIPGVEHVGGSFKESVPDGNLLIMKFCLPNWDDETCIGILTNCRKALPVAEGGKMLIMEPLDRSTEATDAHNEVARRGSLCTNFQSTVMFSGARTRTVEQLRSLALAAGFSQLEFVNNFTGFDLLEASLSPSGHSQ
ncbi:hypothetical protein AXG93_1452s1020 [Marchantia polymorpha subsp. ruderalis]|uniref:Uncharacterized protein n=1 Tax=Marchantia polymorpha subsp. ruderalis TaxID=1480154 RepID=A0A176WTF7_MARPO|nr:hypothetical protein AXG93_1452s1020 [Marchantia polymorpha subsp. ruderalis]